MSQDRKKAGTRWRFQSTHHGSEHLNGREVEITRDYPPPLYDYVVRDETGTWLAVDRELLPLEPAA